MDTWIDEQTEGLVVGRWMDDRVVVGWMDGWMRRVVGGCVDGWVGSWVDGSMNSCFSW